MISKCFKLLFWYWNLFTTAAEMAPINSNVSYWKWKWSNKLSILAVLLGKIVKKSSKVLAQHKLEIQTTKYICVIQTIKEFNVDFSLKLCRVSEHPFHKRVYKLIMQNLQKYIIFYIKRNDQMRSQFCTCHYNWVVMTCANLCSEWIIIFQARPTSIFTNFCLWDHKPFVKRIPRLR